MWADVFEMIKDHPLTLGPLVALGLFAVDVATLLGAYAAKLLGFHGEAHGRLMHLSVTWGGKEEDGVDIAPDSTEPPPTNP